MAGNNVSLSFSLGATLSSSYKAAFSSAGAAIKNVTSSIKQMERTPVGRIGAQMETQREKIKSLAGELRAAKAQLAALQAQEGQAGAATGLLARQIQVAQSNVSNLSRALSRQRDGFKTSAAEAANLAGSVKNLKTQYAALTATMERQKGMQAALVANQAKQAALSSKRGELQSGLVGTVAMAGAAAAPIKLAADFEYAMAKVGAVSRASGEELAALTEKARQLGRDTQYSASEAAEGMQYLAMAGFNVNQTMAAMPGMLDLAAAADLDLGRTADISSNILSGFKLKAEDMGMVGDVLVTAFTKTNVCLESLGESMKYLGPVASAVGMSVQEAGAAVGLLGQVGIQGSQAGTALRAALLRLSAPAKMTKDALAEMSGVTGAALDELYEQMEGFAGGEDAMREVGVSVKDAAGNMRPMADILEELAVKTSNLGNAERAAAFKKIFGTEASAAMIALADAAVKTVDDDGNAIVDAAGRQTTLLRSLIGDLNNSQGAAAKIAEQMRNTTIGALKQMGSAWQDVGISVGNMFLPAIRAASGVLITVANAISSFTQRFPNLSSAIAMAVGGIVAFRVATMAAGLASTFLGGGLTSIVGMVLRVASSQAVATAATGAWTVATTAAHGVAMLANGALGILSGAFGVLRGAISLALGPVGIIISAIGLAAAVIHENWDSMPGWFHDLWDTITGIFSAAWDIISSIVDAIASAVSAIIGGAKKLAGFFGIGGGEELEAPAGAEGGGESAGAGASKSAPASAAAPSGGKPAGAAAVPSYDFSDAGAAAIPGAGGAPGAPAAEPYDLSAQKFETVPPPSAEGGAGGGGGGGGKKSGRKKSGGGGGGGKSAAASAGGASSGGTTIVSLSGDNSRPVTKFIPAGQSVPSDELPGGVPSDLQQNLPASVPAGGALPSLSSAGGAARAAVSSGAVRALNKIPGSGGRSASTPSSPSAEGVTVNLTQDFGIMTSDPSAFRRIMEQLKPDFERLVRRALANISSDRTRTAHAQ